MKLKVIAIGAWLLFTISLSLWWLYFGLSQLELLKAIEGHERVVSQQRMLIWEGASLVVSILIGGAALCYLALKEFRERKRIQEFFSVFSHELKTPLTSIQLQAEKLGAEKLIESTQRLLVHLDNAIFIARLPDDVFYEEVNLRPVIEEYSIRWPSLKVEVIGSEVIETDKRLLEAILSNIFSNAVRHGEATKLLVQIKGEGDKTFLEFRDNGKGFSGEKSSLGQKFKRYSNSGGTGLGLYIIRKVLQKLNGSLSFPDVEQGFAVRICL